MPVGDRPRYVLFSLDPAYDTPRVLRAFAAAHALPAPRWTLLRPDTASLPAVDFKAVAAELHQKIGRE